MLAKTFSRHISTETAIWQRQSAWQRQLPTKFYFVSFRCYNTSEKVCLQGLFHAIFQQKRRFGEDKAHGNGSCRQNSILSRFDVIIQVKKFACKDFFTPYFNRNGDLAKTKRMATAVADKILFCLVSMLLYHRPKHTVNMFVKISHCFLAANI